MLLWASWNCGPRYDSRKFGLKTKTRCCFENGKCWLSGRPSIQFNANQFSQTGPFESYSPPLRLGLVQHLNGKVITRYGSALGLDWEFKMGLPIPTNTIPPPFFSPRRTIIKTHASSGIFTLSVLYLGLLVEFLPPLYKIWFATNNF
jgi:hypothetical protein